MLNRTANTLEDVVPMTEPYVGQWYFLLALRVNSDVGKIGGSQRRNVNPLDFRVRTDFSTSISIRSYSVGNDLDSLSRSSLFP